MTRLLYLEDNPGDVRLLQTMLSDVAPGEFSLTHAVRLKDALELLATQAFDVLLSDLSLPDSDSLTTVCALVKQFPDLPLIVLTGSKNEELGQAAIRNGAQDYLTKTDVTGLLLTRTLRFAIQRKELENKLLHANTLLEQRVAGRTAELEVALAQLQDLLASTEALTEMAADAFITTDSSGNVMSWNRAAESMFGYTKDEVIGQPVTMLMPPRFRQAHTEGIGRMVFDTQVKLHGRAREVIALRKTGIEFPIELSLSSCGSAAKGRFFIGIIRDITQRKQAEQSLHMLLKERESLIREVHHRVKNNLQVITSLLRLESIRSRTPAIKSALGEMVGRIRSMALLHENLHRSEDCGLVDLGLYLRQLAVQAFQSQMLPTQRVQLKLELCSEMIAMDEATLCGLLVNELVSNSLKHGFPQGRSGDILVELRRMEEGSQLCLNVSDSGISLPVDFEERRGQSLGLQLVSDLVKQLDGKLEISGGARTTFSIAFAADSQKVEQPVPFHI